MSYGYTGSYSPQVGMAYPAGTELAATFIEYYDGYILAPMWGHLVLAQHNYDGSCVYVPTSSAGSPIMTLQGIIVSADRRTIQEVMSSDGGFGIVLQYYNTYSYIGDGASPAEQRMLMSAQINSGRNPFKEFREYKKRLRESGMM